MYAKLYDLEKAKYCLIEFKTFVGELPTGVVVGEIVDEYATEKLLEDKKELLEKGCFDFSANNAVKIHNIKAVLSEYDKLKKDVNFYKKEADRVLKQLNKMCEEYDKVEEEKERLKSELQMYKENNERLEKANKELFDKLNECETEKNLFEMKAKDEVEILKGVIKLIIDGKTNEALKVLLEFV